MISNACNSLGMLPMYTTGIEPKCVSSEEGQTCSVDLVVKNQRKVGDRHETKNPSNVVNYVDEFTPFFKNT